MVKNPTEATHAATWPDYLVGGFKYLLFSSLPGEMIKFD